MRKMRILTVAFTFALLAAMIPVNTASAQQLPLPPPGTIDCQVNGEATRRGMDWDGFVRLSMSDGLLLGLKYAGGPCDFLFHEPRDITVNSNEGRLIVNGVVVGTGNNGNGREFKGVKTLRFEYAPKNGSNGGDVFVSPFPLKVQPATVTGPTPAPPPLPAPAPAAPPPAPSITWTTAAATEPLPGNTVGSCATLTGPNTGLQVDLPYFSDTRRLDMTGVLGPLRGLNTTGLVQCHSQLGPSGGLIEVAGQLLQLGPWEHIWIDFPQGFQDVFGFAVRDDP